MKVSILYSTVRDGTMAGDDRGVVDQNRRTFLGTHGIPLERTVLVWLRYEGDNYCRYHEVDASDSGEGIISPPRRVSDALFTREKGLALFLPLADCIGATLVDETQGILGMSHLGRHNLEQFGATRCVEYMCRQFGSSPAQIRVELSPAVGKKTYPLHAFEGRGMHEVAIEQLKAAGISTNNIQVMGVDTALDPNYYSHSQYLKGAQTESGRHAVVAMMHP